MNRSTVSIALAAFGSALVFFQVACSHGQVLPKPEALNTDMASQGQSAPTMCARVGIRLVVVSRKEQPDRSMYYEFAEVADAECTEEKVWKAKR
jgi:hypothetical protein